MSAAARDTESRRIEVKIPMRWGDMDAYGHINNVQVVRILEEARIAAFGPPRGPGLPGIEPPVPLFSEVPEGTLALIVEHKIRYVRTLEYRNIPAVVQLWIGAVKGASFDIHYLVQDPVTGEDCVRATSHLAFVEESTGRVLRLTPEQKDRLAPYAAAQSAAAATPAADPAHPGPAHPDPAQPDPAHPGPAHPDPAQPDPAFQVR